MDLEPPPGRVLIVGPSHTFEQFADAINQAFARWDLSHLHEFRGSPMGGELASRATISPLTWHGKITAKLKVCREVKPGDEFTFTFDFGDNWRHRCKVRPEKADPVEEYGEKPPRPVAIWGWGSIPDQYGRSTLDE